MKHHSEVSFSSFKPETANEGKETRLLKNGANITSYCNSLITVHNRLIPVAFSFVEDLWDWHHGGEKFNIVYASPWRGSPS